MASWSLEQREEALRLYVEFGAGEASKRTGIPAGTIRSWRHRADKRAKAPGDAPATDAGSQPPLAAQRSERVQAAIDGARLTHAQNRSTIGRLASSAAVTLIAQAIDAKPREAADLMRAGEAAVRTAQLLDGGATSRVDLSTDAEEARAQIRRIRDELAERRDAKAA